MTLKDYLIELLKGTKTYIDTENSELNSSISADYGAAITQARQDLTNLINALETKENAKEPVRDNQHTEIWTKLNNHEGRIGLLETDIKKKLDSDFVTPWATYDSTNKIVTIGAPGSTFYIKSTTTGLEIYQGTTKIAYFEGGHLKATDITTSNSMTTPKITIGGLEISGNSTNGWSFR